MSITAAGSVQPQLSIIFLAYQQEKLVAEAVRSMLAQQGVIAEIIFSDDASTDHTYGVMAATVNGYAGPHRLVLRRNTTNQGIDHIVQMVELASCDRMVMAHGDDLSEPHRCRRLLDEMEQTGAFVVCSNFLEIDDGGRPAGLNLAAGQTRNLAVEDIAGQGWQPTMYGATLAWRREVYTRFPRLDGGYLPFGHDTLVPFRGALLGGTRYVHEPLVRYRRHRGQWTRIIKDRNLRESALEAEISAAAMAQLAMSRDLGHLREHAEPAQRESLERLQGMVDERLGLLCRDWILARQAMYRQGLRPKWVERREFEQDGRRRNLRDVRLAARGLYRRLRWELFHR